MQQQLPFWRLESVPDAALLGGLTELIGSSRRVLARLVAHLGEVEERRLHLDAGHGSMFSYCVSRLGLSEDEAYRRIAVSRLARRYPGIYPRLASGQLSLSVAALLKPHLTEANADELLELVSGSSVDRAREQLAIRFPRPDVPSSIRKLPDPRFSLKPLGPENSRSSSMASTGGSPRPTSASAAAESGQLTALGLKHDGNRLPSSISDANVATGSSEESGSTPGLAMERTPIGTGPITGAAASPPPTSARRIFEPLSKGRYKIQLTADEELKKKIELARDLMRHVRPDGDLASILSRALDLLIEQIMKRRFGARSPRTTVTRGSRKRHTDVANDAPNIESTASRSGTHCAQSSLEQRPPKTPCERMAPGQTTDEPSSANPTQCERTVLDLRPSEHTRRAPKPSERLSTDPTSCERTRREHTRCGPTPFERPSLDPRSRRSMAHGGSPRDEDPAARAVKQRRKSTTTIPRATRRAVAERDGLRCTWQGPDGIRCDARAWLENDHRCPRGRGGDASPENIRLLCQAHNKWLAEKEYGRRHIEDSIARSRRDREALTGKESPDGGSSMDSGEAPDSSMG